MEKGMMMLKRILIGLFCCFLSGVVMAEDDNVVNVYVWSQELSNDIVVAFEKETGIKVNRSTFDANEVMYAKLKASSNMQYDVVEPSSYYITRMAREGMLEKLNLKQLSEYKNLNPKFTHPDYDPKGEYSVAWVWGLTGIFVNRTAYPDAKITKWTDLWSPTYKKSLLMLDDPREAFNIGLLTLNMSPNDENLKDLAKAYDNLVALLPNVRLYNSSSVSAMITDGDATIGMAWNADVFKASLENPKIEFIFPEDHFVIWVDAFVIPKNAPHRANAYKFLNFILQAKIAAMQVEATYYPTANKAAMAFLPPEIANNKVIFPDDATLAKGYFQTDINDKALEAMSRYWQQLKLQ
jgi:spermidine/putrescine transport system substrate-binding protein